MINKETNMNKTFETEVLACVKNVTDVPAHFFNGTMFLETGNSDVALNVYNYLYENVTKGLIFGKVGQYETSYDFI